MTEERMDVDAQRAVLERIAALIEEHYFDVQVAASAAAGLRERAPSPEPVEPAAFAEDLTGELRELDRHFGVQVGAWQPGRRPGTGHRTEGPAMEAAVRDGVGVLTVRLFADADDPADAKIALEALQQVAGCRVVVIDLCDVPGGYPSMVELLIGAFVGEEPVEVLTFHGRDRTIESWTRPSASDPALQGVPLYVAVDAGTGSAAESCAYALQSLGRATIVGTPTAGAANPGDAVDTGMGFSVFISMGTPVDPRTHGNWEGTGVVPDVEADRGGELERALAFARAAADG